MISVPQNITSVSSDDLDSFANQRDDFGPEETPAEIATVDDNGLESGEAPEHLVDSEANEGNEDAIAEAQEQVADEVDVAAEEVPAKLSPKANERFRELANRAKSAEARASEVEAASQRQIQLMQQQLVQQQSQMQQFYAAQADMQRQQLDMVRKREEAEAFAKLPREKQLELEWLNKAKGHVTPEVEAKYSELQQQIQQLQAERENERKQAQLNQQRQFYWNGALDSAKKVIIGDLPADEFNPETLAEMTLVRGTAFGEAPQKAAAELKNAFEAYHRAKLKATANKGVSKSVAVKPGLAKAASPVSKKTTPQQQATQPKFSGPHALRDAVRAAMSAVNK